MSGNKNHWYARVFVKNIGRSEAKDVQVVVAEIQGDESEIIDLPWAHQAAGRLGLPANFGRYADLCCTTGSDCKLAVSTYGKSLVKGRNRFKIIAIAANAAATDQVVIVDWDGKFEGIKFC